jgi:hypothetical protein
VPEAAPKAAGPAVDLDDYVSMEEFDRLYEDYEALKKKFNALKTDADKVVPAVAMFRALALILRR